MSDPSFDPQEGFEKLHDIFEAESEIERELGVRGRRLLNTPKQGAFVELSTDDQDTIVGYEWLRIQDTGGTLYVYRQIGHLHDLIYAEDMVSGHVVGRGPVSLMCDACELMRKHMVLDDLADV